MLKISILLLVLFCLCQTSILFAQADVPPTLDDASDAPTDAPVISPTKAPVIHPSRAPTFTVTEAPSAVPSESPSVAPSDAPTQSPSFVPSFDPTFKPTLAPSPAPTSKAVANTETLLIVGILILLFIVASAFILGKWFWDMFCGPRESVTSSSGIHMTTVGSSSAGYQTVDTSEA